MGMSCSCNVADDKVVDKRFDTSRKHSVVKEVEDSSSFSSHSSADSIHTETAADKETTLETDSDGKEEEHGVEGEQQLVAELPQAVEVVLDSDEKRDGGSDDAEAVRQFTEMVALSNDGDISSLQESVDRRRTGVSETRHPPIGEATLQLQLTVLNVDSLRADADRSSSAGSGRRSPRKRSSSLLKKSRSMRAIEASKKAKKRMFEMRANYLRGGKKVTKRKTGKYGCRQWAAHIVDIRETLEFPLEASDGELNGFIEVTAKQSGGKFSKDKTIGCASIPLAVYSKASAIIASDEGIDLTLDFFKDSSERKRERRLTEAYLSPDEDVGDAIEGDAVVCRMEVKLKLVWDQKAWNEYKLRAAAQMKAGGDELICDPMRLMQMSAAKLKLFVVGTVMSSTAAGSWMRMDGSQMAATMRRMGTKTGHALLREADDDCDYHVTVKVERRVHGEDDDVRRGAEHASKTEETVFIGEQSVFEISPFYEHKSTRSLKSMGSAATHIHPEHEYNEFDGGVENPGYLLLTVEKTKFGGSSVEHGCALLKISTLLETATLAPGSKHSDEVIFAEAMFQPLTRGTRKSQRKQPLLKTGFILCKSRFEWE